MNTKSVKERCGCQVESLVSIDERGQMVLPKELRDRAKIKPGDKLAIIAWEKNGEICCLSLIKTDNFNGLLADLLGPMVKEMSEVIKE
jgi:antitoxin PrlF